MPPVGFDPSIPVSEGQQTLALDRAATWDGICGSVFNVNVETNQFDYTKNTKLFYNQRYCTGFGNALTDKKVGDSRKW